MAYTPSRFVAHQKACVIEVCGDFWRQLHDAISLGMAREAEGDSVIAPYTIVKMWDEHLDPYECSQLPVIVWHFTPRPLRMRPQSNGCRLTWLR